MKTQENYKSEQSTHQENRFNPWSINNASRSRSTKKSKLKKVRLKKIFTYDKCKNAASCFHSLSEWSRRGRSSYRAASKNKWHRQIAQELGWKQRKEWTYDNCKDEAHNFSCLNEWLKNSSSSYLAARKNKWHTRIAQELEWKQLNKWTYENCKSEATKFCSLVDWAKKSPSSYSAARTNKWQRKIARELGWKSRKVFDLSYWSYDRCREEASNFSSVLEWKKKSLKSYRAALKNKWHKQIVQELEWNTTWTLKQVKKAFEAYLEQCWNVCSKLPLPEVVGLLRTVDVKSASPKIQRLLDSGDESLRKALHEAMAQRLL